MPIRSPPPPKTSLVEELISLGFAPPPGWKGSSESSTANATPPVLPSNAPAPEKLGSGLGLQVPTSTAVSSRGEGGSAPVSVPGSVHDSADDESESELSELQEGEGEEEMKGIFPHLVGMGKGKGKEGEAEGSKVGSTIASSAVTPEPGA